MKYFHDLIPVTLVVFKIQNISWLCAKYLTFVLKKKLDIV